MTQTTCGGANLDNANLEGARFNSAACARATFRGANLKDSNLRFADLTQADLSGAVFDYAELISTDLEGANLHGSGLQFALFHRANLRLANLTLARLLHTSFSETNLRETTGLDACLHFERSAVDFHTLTMSAPLPIGFLRGVGLPDQVIQALSFLLEPSERNIEARSPHASRSDATRFRVFIAARRLDFMMGLVPANHLSVVVRDDIGDDYEYDGSPQFQVPGAYGRIVVAKRLYRPRPDRQSLRVPLPWDRPASEAIEVLDAELARLNQATIPYEPLFGPNSNAIARTLLLALGLQPLHPTAWAPGFDREAL